MLNSKENEYLKNQIDSEFTFMDIDKLELAYKLIKNVGVKDSEYRDGVYLRCMGHLIHDNHFTNEELSGILETYISDEYLLVDLDNNDEYSVLTRAYTLLNIATLLYVHLRDGVFKKELIIKTYEAMIYYYDKEFIYTGHDIEVGWIHAIAHSADAFRQLMRLKELDKSQIEVIFNLFIDKFHIDNYTFISDEDERTVNAMELVFKSNLLDKDFLIDFVRRLAAFEKRKTFPEAIAICTNVKNLLRSIYFRLLENDEYKYLTDEIIIQLKVVKPW